jgi:tripartite ATP-independent transporter DctM subunit
MPVPLNAVHQNLFGSINAVGLLAVPYFIFAGELMARGTVSIRLVDFVRSLVGRLPGALGITTVGTATVFGAISGSSAAAVASVGKVMAPAMENAGYPRILSAGMVTSVSAIGIVIPPSIPMIVYGALTDTSIPQLYLAGIVPGVVLTVLFMLTVIVGCVARPAWGGHKIEANWGARWRSLPDLIPPLLIFVVVIGSIYGGVATPTESAGLGVVAAFALAAWRRRLSWAILRDTFEGTMKTTAMIMAILIAAYFVNFVITSIGLSGKVMSYVTGFGLSPTGTIIAIVLFYLVLGMFMESLSMLVATVPIITPVVVGLGFNPIWFGVLMMLLIETALITPPVGFNLFVVQGVRSRGQIYDVIIGSAPFVITLMAMIALLVAYPQIALWLPAKLS